jgi:hypothetical protein
MTAVKVMIRSQADSWSVVSVRLVIIKGLQEELMVVN